MPGRKSPLVIVLDPAEKAILDHLVRSPTTLNGVAQRARIILHLAAGMSITQTARQVGVQRRLVRSWGHRFLQQRLAGLADRPRPGRPPVFSPRGGRASGQAGLRAAGSTRPLLVPVGLHGTGTATGTRGDGRAHFV